MGPSGKIILIGHTGYCVTSTTSSSDITPTNTTYTSTENCNVDIVSESYTITNNYCEPYTYYYYEKFTKIADFKSIREGWLKPHKQLRPFENNQIINYNLPRSRLREKKQAA